MRRHRGPVRCAALVVALLLTGACTRSSSEVEVSAGGAGAPQAARPATETTEANAQSRLDNGSFGELEEVCQDGDPSGSPDTGVTGTEINVGTVSDKGSTIRPGLTKEMWDTAVAFTEWCNEHGGINGRQLKLTDLDAKLMEYPSAITKGCQTDFAMVGGGAALDNGDGGAREKCGLVNVGGYAVSATARTASLQVFPLPGAVDKAAGGPFRVLQQIDPEALQHVGFMTGDLQSIVIAKDQEREYIEKKLGGRVVYDQRFAVTGESNWRPFVQTLKSDGVQVLELTGEPDNLIGLQKAMKTEGWNPKYTLQQANFYDATLVAEGGATAKDTWVRSVFFPVEMSEDNPATADYLELMERYNPDGRLALLGQQGLSAWLLFARAAKACGNGLTRDCLLAEAKKVTEWTGGGLHAATNPGANRGSPCFLSLELTDDGFVYDREMTAPTDGLYNCDPENVAIVKSAADS